MATVLPGTVLPGTHAFAQQDATEDQKEVARKYMQSAQRAFENNKFDEAVDLFQKAYQAVKHPAFVYNAALALERAQKREQAASTYEEYLRMVGDKAEDADEVRGRIVRLRNLTLAAPEVKKEESLSVLTVISDPVGATATIKKKGKVVASGKTPFSPTLKPGDYVVEMKHSDYLPKTYRLSIRPGIVKEVLFGLAQNELLARLRITSDPPGAEVFVDDLTTGRLENKTPVTTALGPGKHKLWIKRRGYKTVELEQTISLDDGNVLDVALERANNGFLRVIGQPRGATVYVNGEEVGKVPFEGAVDVGVQEVEVKADDRVSWAGDVNVEAGRLTPVEVTLAHESSNAGAWIASGLTLGVLAASITLGLMSNATLSELEEDIANPAIAVRNTDPRFDEGKNLSVFANVGFGIAGGLAILSAVLFLIDNSGKSQGRVRAVREVAFVPIFAPNAAGGVFSWTF